MVGPAEDRLGEKNEPDGYLKDMTTLNTHFLFVVSHDL